MALLRQYCKVDAPAFRLFEGEYDCVFTETRSATRDDLQVQYGIVREGKRIRTTIHSGKAYFSNLSDDVEEGHLGEIIPEKGLLVCRLTFDDVDGKAVSHAAQIVSIDIKRGPKVNLICTPK